MKRAVVAWDFNGIFGIVIKFFGQRFRKGCVSELSRMESIHAKDISNESSHSDMIAVCCIVLCFCMLFGRLQSHGKARYGREESRMFV